MSSLEQNLDLARQLVTRARSLGADEATVSVSAGSSVSLTRRDGKVEEASEASTRRLSVSLLRDGRYSSHSTSDLRPEALERFLGQAVDATSLVEPDPDRALAPAEECGRGASEAELDHLDPAWASWSADDRARAAERLEAALMAVPEPSRISGSVGVSDGTSRYAVATSHGFEGTSESAWYNLSAEVTLSDADGRRPEGMAYYGACYRSDLPDADAVAAEAFDRAREAIGAGPIASGKYPMLLLNRSAGRVLGTLGGPLSGYNLHQGRSCLADALDTAIGSSALTLIDDPTIPRGLGSTPWDDDLRVAKRRTIVENGVLREHYIDVYHARKLGRAATTSSRSNWILPPGERSLAEIAAELPQAILVTGFLGGNSNPLTGDFSFGVRGRLLVHGEPTARLAEMNVTGNVRQIFHQLAEVADDPWLFSSVRSPSLLFLDVQFSGT